MFKSFAIKLFILLIAFGGLAFWFSTQKPFASKKVLTLSKKNSELVKPAETPDEMQKAVPSSTAPTSTGTPTVNTDNDVALPALPETPEIVGLKEAFSLKYNKSSEAVAVFIEEQNGGYAKGSVDFDGSGYPATFYAYNSGVDWTIVAVENGVVSCSSVNNYVFPSSMISQCYNSSLGTVVYR